MRIITLILLFIFSSMSMACDKRITLTFTGAGEGMVRVFSISENKDGGLPQWKPGSGPVPISISEAYLKAERKFVETGALDEKGYKLSNINILHKTKNKKELWFYMVLFVEDSVPKLNPGQHSLYLKSREIVVLLDGTVLSGSVISEKEFYSRMSSGGC